MANLASQQGLNEKTFEVIGVGKFKFQNTNEQAVKVIITCYISTTLPYKTCFLYFIDFSSLFLVISVHFVLENKSIVIIVIPS